MSMKPCPFCGGEQFVITGRSSTISVQCADCGATGPAAFSEADAMRLWGDRGRWRKGDEVCADGHRCHVQSGPWVSYEVTNDTVPAAYHVRDTEMRPVPRRYPIGAAR